MTGLERLRELSHDVIDLLTLYETLKGDDEIDKWDSYPPYKRTLEQTLGEIADQIESEQADDHEIAEWVRDNGGIENIQDELANDRELAMIVRDALWPDGKVPCCENGNEQIADELGKRLMPPGMEWPRYEDGSPVVLSEFDQNTETISCVAFIHNEAMVDYDSPFVEINPEPINTSGTTIMNIGERVKRPKKGPVGADGLHINDDETVYIVDGNGEPLYVIDTKSDGYQTVIVRNPSGHVNNYDAQRLTHTKPEPPDSWERIKKDALNFVEDNAWIPHSQSQMELDILDLVRRAKALAERERAE